MFDIVYKPNPDTHIPHGISKKYFNCKVCGVYRSPGIFVGMWACCAESPCPCCLREQLGDVMSFVNGDKTNE